MDLDARIEALLFYKAAPQKNPTLLKLFDVTEDELSAALEKLATRLQTGGLRLLVTDSEVQLVTAPEMAEFIESLRKQELSADIGKAGAETLTIVLYREPISRAEIDRIRGVNSAFILRNLMTRGLVTREAAGNSYQFRISPALLQHLGITAKQQLPQFSEFMTAIDAFTPHSNHE